MVNNESWDALHRGIMHVYNMRGIGSRIQKRRNELGWSQGRLGKLCGMTQQGIAKIENNGTKNPRKIIEIADALMVSPQYLLGMEEKPLLDADEAAVVEAYRGTAEAMKQAVRTVLGLSASKQPGRAEGSAPTGKTLPAT